MRRVWNLPRSPVRDGFSRGSTAQAGVNGFRVGRESVKQGGTAGFPVPLGLEIRRFARTGAA